MGTHCAGERRWRLPPEAAPASAAAAGSAVPARARGLAPQLCSRDHREPCPCQGLWPGRAGADPLFSGRTCAPCGQVVPSCRAACALRSQPSAGPGQRGVAMSRASLTSPGGRRPTAQVLPRVPVVLATICHISKKGHAVQKNMRAQRPVPASHVSQGGRSLAGQEGGLTLFARTGFG